MNYISEQINDEVVNSFKKNEDGSYSVSLVYTGAMTSFNKVFDVKDINDIKDQFLNVGIFNFDVKGGVHNDIMCTKNNFNSFGHIEDIFLEDKNFVSKSGVSVRSLTAKIRIKDDKLEPFKKFCVGGGNVFTPTLITETINNIEMIVGISNLIFKKVHR